MRGAPPQEADIPTSTPLSRHARKPARKTVVLLAITPLLAVAPAQGGERDALTVYISPEGAGSQSGETLRDARAFSGFREVMRQSTAPLIIYFAPGRYDLDHAIRIERDAPTTLIGLEDGPEFVGLYAFRKDDPKTPAFRIAGNDISISNIRLRNFGACVKAQQGIPSSNIAIEKLSAVDVYDCILIDRNTTQAVTGWMVTGLRVTGFYRAAVRVAGPNTGQFELRNFRISGDNSAGVNQCWKGGVQILNGAHDITLADGRISRINGDCRKNHYAQGDGVEIDDKGASPENIRIENVTVDHARDAAFDLKARNVSLSNVTAISGAKTRYGMRFWNFTDYVCRNCRIDGAITAAVFANKAQVAFIDSAVELSNKHRLCELKGDDAHVSFAGGDGGEIECAQSGPKPTP